MPDSQDADISPIDHFRGIVQFTGDCADCWHECQAVCCYEFTVPVADEEVASGQYDTMLVDGSHALAKDKHEACVYLDGTKCTIYDRRPVACRQFNCKNWYWELKPLNATKFKGGEQRSTPPTMELDGVTYHFS